MNRLSGGGQLAGLRGFFGVILRGFFFCKGILRVFLVLILRCCAGVAEDGAFNRPQDERANFLCSFLLYFFCLHKTIEGNLCYPV